MSSSRRGRYPVYVPKYPTTWWLRRGPYLRFAAREITSMFAAGFSVLLLAFLFALGSGPKAYASFLDLLDTPWMTAASALVLAAMLYHVATWFRLTSYIVVIRLGRTVVPRRLLVAGLVAAWLGASAAITYFHIWF